MSDDATPRTDGTEGEAATGRHAHGTDGGREGLLPDGGRRTVELPDTIELPRLLDFYELQTAEHTRIHEFYDRLREGVLSTTRCADCDALHYPPRVVCPECTGEDLEYVELPDTGTLYAFSALRGGAPMGMADEAPFTVGVVDLDGVDVRLSARIDGATVEDLDIGDPVELAVVDVDGPADHERVFYRFEPAGATGGEPTHGDRPAEHAEE
ncbi:Zn-ribbon domain-containing OB-fold protein [Halorarum halobium]|uniref:Zn-ribbon domain-containing OB-fold protein n=1 Tax=Halorarum halobium TaxID=3075121 RepID=UPI0028A8EFD4|nr:Zn-ribbon domain-containing OB-fold protein [Halobaculum sp. XH14]